MSIILPNAYALTLAAAENGDYPILGHHNLVTVATLTVDEEDANFPGSNLANPATNLLWKSGSTNDQYLTVLFGEEVEVDYIGLARHNLGTAQAPLTVQGLPFGGNPATPGDWDELIAQHVLANDRPTLWRWEPQSLIGVRIKIEPDTVEPQAAALYAGKLLVFERGVQPGHTPVPYGRQRNKISPKSQAGDHLGTIISGGRLVSSVSINKLTAAWYRSTLDPFFDVAAELPFFWAWKPLTYSTEVGYCVMANDPAPVPDISGYIDVQMQLEGLIL